MRFGFATTLLIVFLAIPQFCLGNEIRYELVEIGGVGWTIVFAFSLNSHSQVVGVAENPLMERIPFIWQDGIITELFCPDEACEAYFIGDGGHIVFTGVVAARPVWQQFYVTDGVQYWTLRNLEGGTDVLGVGRVNATGQVAGQVSGPNGMVRPVRWDLPDTIPLALTMPPTWERGWAFAINDFALCAGGGYDGTAGMAATWDPDPTALQLVGDLNAAWGINDAGAVVGVARVAGKDVAVRWIAGLGEQLPFLRPSDTYSSAWSLDNKQDPDITGKVANDLSDYRAVIWRHGEPFDLNDEIPQQPGLILRSAGDINDKGEILVGDADSRVYLLRPICPHRVPWDTDESFLNWPHIDPRHPADSARAGEQVDVVTGALNLFETHASFPGNAGHDLDITAAYSSKLRVHDAEDTQETSVEPSSYGVGWQLHQGRLYIGTADTAPVFERPGLRPQRFFPPMDGGYHRSDELWTLHDETVAAEAYKVVTDADGLRYWFPAETEDRRNPLRSYLYASSIVDVAGNSIEIDYSTAYLDGWPYISQIRQQLGTATRAVNFAYVDDPAWPDAHPGVPRPIESIRWLDSSGADATVAFTLDPPAPGDCRSLLRSTTDARDLTTSYDYDPATLELTRVTLPTNGTFQYEYASHIHAAAYGPERTRVVRKRRVLHDDPIDGPTDHEWLFAYPDFAAPSLPSLVTYPQGAGFQEVSWNSAASSPDWLAGLPTAVRYQAGNADLLSLQEFTFAESYQYAVDYSTAPAPAHAALLTESMLQLAGPDSAYARTTFAYDCHDVPCSMTSDGGFARPGEIVHREFGSVPTGGGLLETVQRSFDFSSPLLTRNILNRPSTYDSTGFDPTYARHESYDYITDPMLGPIGAPRHRERLYETLGGSTGGGSIESHLEYGDFGNLRRIVTGDPMSPIIANATFENGRLKSVFHSDDPLLPDFTRTIDVGTGLVASQLDRNGQSWRYEYDSANRLKRFDVPSALFDDTTISYAPDGRSDLTESNLAQFEATYDELGRLDVTRARREQIGLGYTYSHSRQRYDSLGRANRFFEPDDAPPTGPHTLLTFDVLGRPTTRVGVGTDEGLTTWVYNGNTVTMTPPVGPPHTETYSVREWLLESATAAGSSTYAYDPSGALRSVESTAPVQLRSFQYNHLGMLISESHPESGLARYEYNENGQLLSRTDADGTTSHYQYELGSKNRLQSVTINQAGQPAVVKQMVYDDPAVAYSLDRLCAVLVPQWQTEVRVTAFDEHGHPLGRRELIMGSQFDTGYTYNSQGLPDTITYPYQVGTLPRTSTRFVYNAANLVSRVEVNGTPLVENISYTSSFGTERRGYRGGIALEVTASPLHRWRPERLLSVATTDVFELNYAYTPDGLVDHVLTNGRLDQAAYDPVRRLASIRYGPSATDQVDYGYDDHGNVRSQSTANPLWAMLPGFSFNHTIDPFNRVSGLPYTSSGRPQADLQGFQYSYGPDGELLQRNGPPGDPGQLAYAYNGFGDRVWRGAFGPGGPSGSDEYYVHDWTGSLLSILKKDNQTGQIYPHLDYIRANGEVVGSFQHRPGTMPQPPKYEMAYLNDHLGSIRRSIILSRDGAFDGRTFRQSEYFPYGYSKSDVDLVSFPVGEEPDIRVGFQGHLREPGTLLWHFGARYHHAGLGRFLSTDPINSADPSNPHTWNKYAFVAGNPLRYIDPDGRAWYDGIVAGGKALFNAWVQQQNAGSAAVSGDACSMDPGCAANRPAALGPGPVIGQLGRPLAYTENEKAIGAEGAEAIASGAIAVGTVAGGLALMQGSASAAAFVGPPSPPASPVPFPGFQDWGRGAVGWGQGAKGASVRIGSITAAEAAGLDPAKVLAAREFYADAASGGVGGEAAKLRVELMNRILGLQKPPSK